MTITFGQFARQARKDHALTQHQVTEYLGGTHRSYMCHLESGYRNWQLWQVEKFAEMLGSKTSELIAEFEYFQQNPEEFRS